MKRNEFVAWQLDRGPSRPGVDSDDFPLGMVHAPVTLNANGNVTECMFYGGLVGVSIDDDYTVRPVSGIAVQRLTEER